MTEIYKQTENGITIVISEVQEGQFMLEGFLTSGEEEIYVGHLLITQYNEALKLANLVFEGRIKL